MKKTIIIASILFASISSFAQQPAPSNPVHLQTKDVDSTKVRLQNLSVIVSGIPELTQGKAKEIQQILLDIFNTIIRNEDKPKDVPAKEKPKQ